MVTKWTDSLTSNTAAFHDQVEGKAKLPLNWEPVSGYEPLACRYKKYGLQHRSR